MPVTTLRWTESIALQQQSHLHELPTTAGLYRVQAVDDPPLAYVGQTGRSLRERVSALRGAFNTEMPYRDPHTAAPALWAWLATEPAQLTVSVCPVDGATPWRKALEAVAIANHRQQHGLSPRWNFGRMPPGYRMSSANNTKLVTAGKRHRGAATTDLLPAHAPGIAPQGPLDPDVQGIAGAVISGAPGTRSTTWPCRHSSLVTAYTASEAAPSASSTSARATSATAS